jgi:hypothetical protein
MEGPPFIYPKLGALCVHMHAQTHKTDTDRGGTHMIRLLTFKESNHAKNKEVIRKVSWHYATSDCEQAVHFNSSGTTTESFLGTRP